MSHNGFIKGIAIGMIAGAAIGVAAAPRGKNVKRTTGRFLKTAGDIIENISCMWH